MPPFNPLHEAQEREDTSVFDAGALTLSSTVEMLQC